MIAILGLCHFPIVYNWVRRNFPKAYTWQILNLAGKSHVYHVSMFCIVSKLCPDIEEGYIRETKGIREPTKISVLTILIIVKKKLGFFLVYWRIMLMACSCIVLTVHMAKFKDNSLKVLIKHNNKTTYSPVYISLYLLKSLLSGL